MHAYLGTHTCAIAFALCMVRSRLIIIVNILISRHFQGLQMSIVCMQVYGKKTPLFINIINGVLCVTLFFVTIVSSVSSIRYIVVDSVNYHVFANL